MKSFALAAALMLPVAAPAPAQQTPAPTATATPAPELTEAEQNTLKKCMAMAPAQQAQSSKCSKVMTKAGKADPAKSRGPDSSTNPPA